MGPAGPKTRDLGLGTRNMTEGWSELSSLHTSSEKAYIRFKNQGNEDAHANWASPCNVVTRNS